MRPDTITVSCLGMLTCADMLWCTIPQGVTLDASIMTSLSPCHVALTATIALSMCYRERQSGFVRILLWTLPMSVFIWSSVHGPIQEKGLVLGNTLGFQCYILLITVNIVLTLYDAYGVPVNEKQHKRDKNQVSPEERASFLSKITFQWVNEIIQQGNNTVLSKEVLPKINSKCVADNIMREVEPFYEKEFSRAQSQLSFKQDHKEEIAKRANVLKVIVQAFWRSAVFCVFLKISSHALSYACPWILKKLIKFFEGKNGETITGLQYAVCLFLFSVSRTLVDNQLDFHNNSLQFRIKTSLMSLVYKKMLTLSNTARQSSTVGEIVNVMSIDSGRFSSLVHWIHNIWIGPFDVFVSLLFLFYEVGTSALAGFCAILIFLPVNGYITRWNKSNYVALTQYLTITMARKRDERLRALSEILNGIKVLKLYAWEESFEKRILLYREEELSLIKRIGNLNSLSTLVWHIGPFLVSLSTFAVFTFREKDYNLNAEKVFVSMAIFDILGRSMLRLPQSFSVMTAAMVALKRINNFLNNEELDPDAVLGKSDQVNAISIKSASFSWDDVSGQTLQNVALEIPHGSLVAIVGPVGCGKSSLLSAMLGDMTKCSGTVNVTGSTAYVPQQAWIQNASLQDNILFGKPLDLEKYSSVIEDCALKGDLEILPKGDKTEIGEKGINLSGGQKQRVSIARAVYQNADVYLLDDPLSAVDAHVGKHIFDKVIGPSGVLNKKTRVFVTHGITYLPKVDLIITLNGGRISEIGTYRELVSSGGPFSKLLQSLANVHNNADEGNMKDVFERQLSIERQRTESIASTDDGEEEGLINDLYDEPIVIQEETGKDQTLKLYFKYFGQMTAVFAIFIVLLYRLNEMFSQYWLSDWTTDKSPGTYTETVDNKKSYRIIIYAFTGLFQGLLGFSQTMLLYYGGLHASRKLYQRMLRSVISSPMSFFETNAVGRIVSRFAKDVEAMDWFPVRLKILGDCVSTLVAVPLTISFNMPYFLVTLVPIIFIYRNIQNFHVPTTRQLKRLETSTRSPIYTHFGESINGAATIRAYGVKARFESESRHKIDNFNKAIMSKYYVYRWLAVRLEFLSSCLVLCAATFAVFTRDVLSAGIAAVCITCTLNTTHELNRLMQVTLNADEELLSIHRINEYIRKPTEAAWRVANEHFHSTWPKEGRVMFNRYSVRYRKDLDLVLRRISCEIAPGEKVGIVGRTGAGKSSLTMALFRIIERESGSITIDDIDISNIGLHDLRLKLTIIPQDPVLFSGTLRMNLDPFNHYSDESLWDALDHAHLGGFVRTLPKKLYHECMEGGENLSVGQRQLVCLARALLRKTRILILDEATAAVDMETDNLIQKTIRTEFAECTILTIAHRLNTVMDYDKIMVLASGKIREFDTPKNLLKNRNTIFYSMARDAKCI